MSMLRTILYSLNDGLYNIKRGGITGIISIITIAFSMLNLGLFLLLWINISPLLKGWMDEVKVLGYLREDICEERIAVSHYNHGFMSIFAYLVAISSETIAEVFSGREVLVSGC